jgi:hypothetical protein
MKEDWKSIRKGKCSMSAQETHIKATSKLQVRLAHKLTGTSLF